jgi:AcrR family transcriptional regulator
MSQEPDGGRTNQKARTRGAILASAAALIRAGKRPTVEDAALAVGISKRTAYRYFVSQEHMLADAALEALRPRMEELLSSVAASKDVYTRIRSLAVALRRLSEEYEPELREMMRASLATVRATDAAAPRARGNRRLDWIRLSLEPVRDRFSSESFTRLTNSLAVCLGIDALIVLRDICGVTGREAEETMVDMATVILNRSMARESKSNAKS